MIECLLYLSPTEDYNLTLLSPVLNVSWKAPDNIWGHAVFVTVRMLILLDVFANPELKATSQDLCISVLADERLHFSGNKEHTLVLFTSSVSENGSDVFCS